MRVMYREGPEGTPFHTLLAEGLIYSSIVSSLCLAWEAPLYSYWWPQFTMPAFKIIESRWVKRLGIGEDLALIRVRVPWPLSTREVVLWAFELEHLEDDLIIVLIQSVPSSEILEERVHGFTADDIPNASPDIVRMDLVGGFALQRITDDQSYFRTITNLDIKLDFIPAWLINFVSRQLIGHGFRLYQKTLISISNGDGNSEVFRRIMASEPMYTHTQAELKCKKASGNDASVEVETMDISSMEKPVSHNGPGLLRDLELEKREEDRNAGIYVMKIGDEETSSGDFDVISSCAPENRHFVAINVDSEGNDYSGGQVDPEVKAALHLLDKMISFAHATSSTASSPHTQELENIPKPFQDLTSTVSTIKVVDERSDSFAEGHRFSKQRQVAGLEEVLQPSTGKAALHTTEICSGDAIDLARKPKFKNIGYWLCHLCCSKG
eukprot:c28273_g1_i2 orf=573-1886(-)